MVQGIRENGQNAMDKIIVVAFLLSGKLHFENFISFFHDIQEHSTDIEFLQGKFGLQMQEIRVCLTDEGKDPAGILIWFDCQFVCIYDGFAPELFQLVDGG